jgi:hypothetical protein
MADNLYVLRVRLAWAKGVWREIAIRSSQTLDDLHRGILDAFEWSEDDSYCFYMSNDPNDLEAAYSPDSDLPTRNPKSARIADFDLDEDHAFIYVFGAGERNQFPIKVMFVDEPEPGVQYPDIVDENGESPSQELAYIDDFD